MAKTNKDVEHNPYREYLKNKHSGMNTPNETIVSVVEKATGSEFVEKSKIVAGEMNEVYDVTLQNHENVIVRISRRMNPRFEEEEKAIQLATQKGVPCPKVLLVENLEHEGEKLTFCVEERIKGEPLLDIRDSLSKDAMKKYIFEAGVILSNIHSVRVDGFGNFDKNTPYNKWSEYILEPLRKIDRIKEVAKDVGIEEKLITNVASALKDNVEIFDNTTPQLLHGDFSIKHLLVKNNKIVGIVDFENAKGGDPVFDLAWFDYFYGEDIPREWIRKGYSNKKIFDKDFDKKMFLYQLYLGLIFLDYYESEKNVAGLEHARKKLIKDASSL